MSGRHTHTRTHMHTRTHTHHHRTHTHRGREGGRDEHSHIRSLSIFEFAGMSAEASFGCTAHVVVPCVNKTDDLIIGVVDGGRSRDATSTVSTVLGDIVEEEYEMQLEKAQGREGSSNLGQHTIRKSTLDEEERLQYLKQSVLSCHRCVRTSPCYCRYHSCVHALGMLMLCRLLHVVWVKALLT